MNKNIESLKATRQFLLKVIEDLSPEQLNKIPAGFNNNVIWNIAHLVASQQGVCYKRAGLELLVDGEFFNRYKPDSKPAAYVSQAEIEHIKTILITTIDQFEKDYRQETFRNYPSWTTRYGVELNNIEDALTFLPFHEGLHVGYVMALKRVV